MPKPKNMREAAIRNHYLTRLSELLRQIYIRRPSSSTKTSDVHQHLSGFIEAALISRTVSNTDIQAAVDQYEIFRNSITRNKSRTARTSKTCKSHVSRSRRRVARHTYHLSRLTKHGPGLVYKKGRVICRVLL